MGFIRDRFLGGAEERAGETQARAAEAAQQNVAQANVRAREDLAPFTATGADAFQSLAEQAEDPGIGRFVNEFNELTDLAPGQTAGTTGILNLVRGEGELGRLIRGGPDVRSINVLRDEILAGPETDLERKEGFDDILQAAAAVGKRRGGGTFRDLLKFNEGLNQRNRGTRISELSGLVGIEQALRQGRLNELLTGRNQRLRELGIADAAETGTRSRRIDELLQRFDLNRGVSQDRFNRTAAVAGTGFDAAIRNAAGERGLGSDIAGLTVGAGNARAAGLIGKKNATLGTLSDLVSLGTGFLKPRKNITSNNGVFVGGGLVA